MQIREYWAVLVKRWWVIALTVAAAAASAYVVSKLIPPTYRAQTVYLVVANRPDNGLNIVLRSTMNSYRELVLQPDALEAVSQQLQLDVSGERLLRDVYIQPRPDDQKIAGAVGVRLEQEVTRLNANLEGTDRINVTRIQQPRLVRVQPNTRINVLAGAFLGLVIGILLAFILEYLDDTLKNSSDVERFVGLTTLGAIPVGESK